MQQLASLDVSQLSLWLENPVFVLFAMFAVLDLFAVALFGWAMNDIAKLRERIDKLEGKRSKQASSSLVLLLAKVRGLDRKHERCDDYHCGPCQHRSNVTCKQLKPIIELAVSLNKADEQPGRTVSSAIAKAKREQGGQS